MTVRRPLGTGPTGTTNAASLTQDAAPRAPLAAEGLPSGASPVAVPVARPAGRRTLGAGPATG
ncbi:hypothetical protein [Streptomyces sp. NPDC058657]|uniref:hypothetical protein n=1 Tax=unclassified Streptomyces TaxID=2593676 RepID=UPI00364E2B1A